MNMVLSREKIGVVIIGPFVFNATSMNVVGLSVCNLHETWSFFLLFVLSYGLLYM